MFKINLFLIVLAAILLLQVRSGGSFFGNSGLSFDINRSSAFINSGNCYVTIGSTFPSSKRIGTRYYNHPYGWRQYQNRLYIPNILRQKGQWNFGLRVTDDSSSLNEMFKIVINGLQLRISPLYGSSSKNLIIRENFRSDGSSEDQYQNFLNSLNSQDKWFSGPSNAYWYPSQNSVQSGSRFGSAPIRNLDLDVQNILYDDDNLRSSFILSSTPSVSVSGSSSSSGIENRAVLDRQVNANRQIQQLTSTVKQLKNNIQSSSGVVSRLTGQLNRIKGSSSQCNDKIFDLSNKKTTIFNTVSNLRLQINQAKAKIEDFGPGLAILNQKRQSLIEQRDEIERFRPTSQTLSQWQSRAISCDNQVQEIRANQTRIQRAIDQNQNKIYSIRRTSSDAPNQINLARQQLSIIDSTINELQTKLAQAKSQRVKTLADINTYEQLSRTSNSQISNLQSLNLRLKTQSSSFRSKIDSKVLQCDNFDREVLVIRKEIADKQDDYQELAKQIAIHDNLIASKRNQISRFQSEASVLPIRLSSLQSELSNSEVALQRQYQICSQNSDAISRLQSDLRAAQLKFDTQSKFLNDAQSKLTSALANKRSADDDVDRYLGEVNRYTDRVGSTTTSSLPVSGSLRTNFVQDSIPTSTTSGRGQIYRTSPIPIGSVTDYITNVYGPSVREYSNPYRLRSSSLYSTMYPVSSTTLNALYGKSSAGIFLPKGSSYLTDFDERKIGSFSSSNLLGDFTCSSTNDYISGYGKILSVQPGYIVISSSDGRQTPLRVADCSRMESNKPNFVLSTSDNIFYKGKKSSRSDIHLTDLTCLV